VGKYSDGEIRNCKKITLKITANYFGMSPLAVGMGMRNDLLPNGFAAKMRSDSLNAGSITLLTSG